MPVAVLKLGSSVVADDSGALRLAVVARVCEEGAALHASGVDVVVVAPGAVATPIWDKADETDTAAYAGTVYAPALDRLLGLSGRDPGWPAHS